MSKVKTKVVATEAGDSLKVSQEDMVVFDPASFSIADLIIAANTLKKETEQTTAQEVFGEVTA